MSKTATHDTAIIYNVEPSPVFVVLRNPINKDFPPRFADLISICGGLGATAKGMRLLCPDGKVRTLPNSRYYFFSGKDKALAHVVQQAAQIAAELERRRAEILVVHDEASEALRIFEACQHAKY
ncbi:MULTISPECIES: hypothetical protein [unclassified Leclercia]|uniref:Uncharacterized protein n=1 Tax=Leclercia barmai TaxID=2785629 RepID=A0ABS7RZ58_9ENTR|nr:MULTISPECIES: hypothetical protein [unclassified Leclercia]MBZ0059592.1 hypothetical protein [Leclercia sp. EMC7]MCM5697276.1 hypothetical protein [Leclercia sp. LTM01]MCM5702129.1 hypothetical protein [Leclercia sp. LTM14]